MAMLQSSVSSSSSFSYGFTYDAFLSFRGGDTRYGFTGNLNRALCDKGIRTFMDDRELQGGEEITSSLFKAIEESRIFIPVLSINYASSSFCLDELVHIIHCFKESGRLVLPIFYDVEPSHVRHHKGSYGKALDDHIERFQNNKHSMDRLQKWKIALTQTANFSGHQINPSVGNEFELINKIVEDVSRILNGVPSLHAAVSDVSQTRRVVQVIMLISLRVFQAETTWRVIGFMSCIVGLLCYALSPSFNRLFGRWNPFKVFLYVALSLAILTTILVVKQASPSTRHVQLKNTCITFVVLMIISVYSFFYDEA
ncbi:putative TIR domain-containing protein [Medicago truncatula]|uniref:Putative TIR domain-containing protein n=2 Tax=Medicago truncatula TaxID=3880 RepID=A0A396HKR2_MEDTR|nr:putative TIR domain-containing protein [Medicago truncatula]